MVMIMPMMMVMVMVMVMDSAFVTSTPRSEQTLSHVSVNSNLILLSIMMIKWDNFVADVIQQLAKTYYMRVQEGGTKEADRIHTAFKVT
jgi:hypothetical protein